MVICKVLGHKMQARYHSKLPERKMNFSGYWDAAELEAMKTKTYVHDICARCGLIIKGESK